MADATSTTTPGASAPGVPWVEAVAFDLLAMYRKQAPKQVRARNDIADWGAFGGGITARCAYLLESILALRQRPIDASILVRCLFEHVVTFAWTAINADERLPRIAAKDFKYRIAVDNEVEGVTGHRMMPPAIRNQHEAFLATKPDKPPSLDVMAKEADEHWAPLLPKLPLSGKQSLAYGYTMIYRHFSAFTHPTFWELEYFVSNNPTGGTSDIRFQGDADFTAVTIAPIYFGQHLIIVRKALGWRETMEADVYAIFERCKRELLRG